MYKEKVEAKSGKHNPTLEGRAHTAFTLNSDEYREILNISRDKSNASDHALLSIIIGNHTVSGDSEEEQKIMFLDDEPKHMARRVMFEGLIKRRTEIEIETR
jgi:hypothetical protein